MKKRILVFNWWDIKNPKAGGAEVYLFEVFSRLAKKGWQIDLICSSYQKCNRVETVNNIKIIRIGSIWTINLRSILWYLKKRNQYDLVIDFTNKVPYLLPVFSSKSLAVTLDVFGEMIITELGFWGKVISNLQRLMLKLYKRTNFIAMSNSTKIDLVNIGIKPRQIKVVYPGADFNKYRPGKKSKTPLVLYVGRLQRYKRLDWAILAFKRIIGNRKDLTFVIVGAGRDFRRLKNIVKNEKLNSKVKFLGFVSEKEKVKWYQRAWLNVQPSVKEGWGLSVLEAGACAVPTIAADVPGLRESVLNGKTGWLFEKDSLDDFAGVLKKAILDERLIKKIGKKALNHSRNFSWDKTTQLFEKELESFLAKIALKEQR